MRTHSSLGRRLVAVLGAAAVGLVGLAGAAVADQGTDGTAPGNAETGTTGTLVIHKHAGTTSGDENNGTEQTVDRPVLAGVTYTVCKVDGYDLTTSVGWSRVKDATVDTAKCGSNELVTETTGSDGTATFDSLAIGLYLVTETSAPEGVTKAAPFLVTVPYPSEDTTAGATPAPTTWLWTVHVYPKNTVSGNGEKTVADPATYGLGSVVPWTITTRPIGSFNGGAPLTVYKIIDQMDPNLQYASTTSLQYKTPAGSLATVDSSYYTIDPSAPATSGGGRATVTFNTSGLAWLNTLQAGTVFQWDLKTTVVGVGTLENKALENSGADDVTIGSATTSWGQATLLKVDATNASTVLSGATFEVYNSTGDACTTLGERVNVSGQSSFISDKNGVVTIPGLYVGKDGAQSFRAYCVVETQAPTGYVTPTGTAARTLITVTAGAVTSGTYSATVKNTPTTVPSLPLTGANGQLLMTVGGLALVLLAGGGALVVRSKRHQD